VPVARAKADLDFAGPWIAGCNKHRRVTKAAVQRLRFLAAKTVTNPVRAMKNEPGTAGRGLAHAAGSDARVEAFSGGLNKSPATAINV
jgi:hypothetical protein